MLKFATLLLLSHFGAMQIFRLTTYHAYFWKALPLLVGFGAFVGWLLFYLNLHEFFLWQIVLASAWLFLVARKQGAVAKAMLQAAGDDSESVRFVAASAFKTASYYTYSAFIYVVSLSVAYLWFYNT